MGEFGYRVLGHRTIFRHWKQTKALPRPPRDHGKETYDMGSERLVSRPMRLEPALGVCHGVCVSSGHFGKIGVKKRRYKKRSFDFCNLFSFRARDPNPREEIYPPVA
jgi:hypothetical protein